MIIIPLWLKYLSLFALGALAMFFALGIYTYYQVEKRRKHREPVEPLPR
jgi:hypothetical protein